VEESRSGGVKECIAGRSFSEGWEELRSGGVKEWREL